MEKRKIVDSFTDAINGILDAIRTERNMRVHFLSAALVLILSAFTDLSRWEAIALLVAIALVIMAELSILQLKQWWIWPLPPIIL